MKIGVISDIHSKTKYLEYAIDKLQKLNIEFLICAGDIVLEENLKPINQFKNISVFGNNDFALLNLSAKYNIFKEPYYFKLDNKTFKLMHLPYYMSADCDIIIFGHTHKFEVNFINNTLFLNPGEICAREKPLIEFATLHITQEKYIIEHFFSNPSKINWDKETFSYFYKDIK